MLFLFLQFLYNNFYILSHVYLRKLLVYKSIFMIKKRKKYSYFIFLNSLSSYKNYNLCIRFFFLKFQKNFCKFIHFFETPLILLFSKISNIRPIKLIKVRYINYNKYYQGINFPILMQTIQFFLIIIQF